MAVTGKREWYIAVVILGRDFRYQKITWDEQLITKLIEVERSFWNQNVIPGIMPEPDGSQVCDEILARHFHTAQWKKSIPLVGFDEKLERREQLLQEMKMLDQEQKQIDQEIKCFMQENEAAFNDKYQIRWTNVDTTKLDAKRLKEEKPEIYQDFVKTTTSRRFSVKAA